MSFADLATNLLSPPILLFLLGLTAALVRSDLEFPPAIAKALSLFLLFAANVQGAADLTLIARRVAERCLVPGLVAMDVEQTAMAMQDVRLPDDDLLRLFVGDPHAVSVAHTLLGG